MLDAKVVDFMDFRQHVKEISSWVVGVDPNCISLRFLLSISFVYFCNNGFVKVCYFCSTADTDDY